jgi:hypothetical protein
MGKLISFTTERGSRYNYLADGRTQRHKAATGETFQPQDITVFVPPYEWISSNYSHPTKTAQEVFGDNPLQYEQVLQEYLPGDIAGVEETRVYVIDEGGRKLRSNEEVRQSRLVFLAFLPRGKLGNADFTIPVSKVPKIGYSPFDTRKFDGGRMRDLHLGHKVIEIGEVEDGGK